MKIEFVLPEHFITGLENRLADKLNQILEERVKLLQEQSLKRTRTECAKKLRISLPTLDDHIKEGRLKTERVGRHVHNEENQDEENSRPVE